MIKQRLIKYIECDGCRKEIEGGKQGIVTFMMPDREKSYDLCVDCAKEFEALLTRGVPEKTETKTLKDLKAEDFSADARANVTFEEAPVLKTGRITFGDERGDDYVELIRRLYNSGEYDISRLAREIGARYYLVRDWIDGVRTPYAKSVSKLQAFTLRYKEAHHV